MIGIITGVTNVTVTIALTSLLFSGPLVSGLGLSVTIMLIGCVLISLIIGLFSPVKNSLAHVQETSIAILSTALLSMTMNSTANPEGNVATALAIIGGSSLVTGAIFWISGHFKLGKMVRFVPFPVVAGFLAGSGWLLLDAAASMLSGHFLGPDFFMNLADTKSAWLVFPAIIFATILTIVINSVSNPSTLPLLLVVAIGGFYAILWWTGITVEDARALSQLPTGVSAGIQLPGPDLVAKIDWLLVLAALPAMLIVAGLNLAGLMLNVSGVELALGKDVDVDRELRVSGLANIASGGICSLSGYVGLSQTILAEKAGATGRGVGIVTTIVMVLCVIVAGDFIYYIPTFITGGFLLFLAFELINDWAIKVRKTMPFSEWLIIVAILFTIAVIGFTEGLAAGLVISITVFVFKYAKVPVIQSHTNGSEMRSKVDRSPQETKFLTDNGDLIQTIRLGGYLFFGTAEQVVVLVRRLVTEPISTSPEIIILDFTNVSGSDSAAITCFVKIRKIADEQNIYLIMTGLNADLKRNLVLAGLDFQNDPLTALGDTLDHALEAAEERILQEHTEADQQRTILDYFAMILGDHKRLPDVIAHMEERNEPPETVLISQGEKTRDVFFVCSGRIRVEVVLPDGKRLTVRKLLSGAVVGEMAHYLDITRTANVITDTQSRLFVLDADEFEKLEKNDPELSMIIHRFLASSLSDKLMIANKFAQGQMR